MTSGIALRAPTTTDEDRDFFSLLLLAPNGGVDTAGT